MPSERLPDFFIVGAMKGGSTTLYQRLAGHPHTSLPRSKEPNFFTLVDPSARQWHSYRRLFATGPGITGEASVAYSDPRVSSQVADRVVKAVPRAKIVFLARDPIARLRSHYLHEVLRGREARPLGACVTDAGSTYVARSMYTACLSPYLREFGGNQVLVIESERIDEHEQWVRLERFLALPHEPLPSQRFNVSSERPRETTLMRWARKNGVLRLERRTPAAIRRLAKPLLLRTDDRVAQARQEAQTAPISDDVRALLHADAERFADLVGWAHQPWDL